MILYNFFIWVEFNQKLNNCTKFSELDNELCRAKLLLQELNRVCSFCSSLLLLVAGKDVKPDKKALRKYAQLDHHGQSLKLVDTETGEEVVRTKLRYAKRTDDNDYSSESQVYEAVDVLAKKVILSYIKFEDDDDIVSFEMDGQEYKFMLRDKLVDHHFIRSLYDQVIGKFEQK